MGKIFRFWILAFAIAGFSLVVYSQIPGNGPPEPMQAQGNGNKPCGRPGGPGNNPGNGELPRDNNGVGIPPPVGLCLPINDYLLPLLVSGIALGSFMIYRIEKAS